MPAAWSLVRDARRQTQCCGCRAAALVGALGGAEEFRAISEAAGQEPLRAAALYALGHVGTADAVEICIAHMADPKAARAAGEAYCAITGVELERDKPRGG